MRYMLDTNTFIYLIKYRPAEVLEMMKQVDTSDICISSVTYSEVSYAIEKGANAARNRIALVLLLSSITILPFDDRAACEYGMIKSELERSEIPIGALNTMIAAHARSSGCTLVTNNIREFKRVRNIRIEKWV
ncbi:MAG: PIN domain-containing protein [Lachnospiraceae bacterium]|nr:PIN domain-containing protein [Lachnospiraceae bacterium]